LEDRQISAKSIAEQLGISRERVGSIIHEDLDMWKVTKGVLFLHDNVPAHLALATQKKLAYLGFQCLDHPPYSTDLAPERLAAVLLRCGYIRMNLNNYIRPTDWHWELFRRKETCKACN
jgi:hypothetical protein